MKSVTSSVLEYIVRTVCIPDLDSCMKNVDDLSDIRG
jgi:hypothetical protein